MSYEPSGSHSTQFELSFCGHNCEMQTRWIGIGANDCRCQMFNFLRYMTSRMKLGGEAMPQ